MASAPTVGAIPTTYAGVTFRSRLEARWAVFFDGIGIEWHHEPEGYTDGATGYLPDFWIPQWDCFWEVKPDSAYDRRKPEMLARLTGKDVYVAFELPWGSVRPFRSAHLYCRGAFGDEFGAGIYPCETGDLVAGPDENFPHVIYQYEGQPFPIPQPLYAFVGEPAPRVVPPGEVGEEEGLIAERCWLATRRAADNARAYRFWNPS